MEWADQTARTARRGERGRGALPRKSLRENLPLRIESGGMAEKGAAGTGVLGYSQPELSKLEF